MSAVIRCHLRPVYLKRWPSYSKKFDIVAEQVEDEVGVVNMALGAWYSGARAMVTTSGGGFALMTEGDKSMRDDRISAGSSSCAASRTCNRSSYQDRAG